MFKNISMRSSEERERTLFKERSADFIDKYKELGSAALMTLVLAKADTTWGEKLDRIEKTMETLNKLDKTTIEGYFLTFVKTENIMALTDIKTLKFIESLGSAAGRYLGAIINTNSIDVLVSERVMKLALSLNGDTEEYFWAVERTRNAEALADERTIRFIEALDEHTHGYLWAIRLTGNAKALTDPRLTSHALADFIKGLGKNSTTYFLAIGRSNAVGVLADKSVRTIISGLDPISQEGFLKHASNMDALGIGTLAKLCGESNNIALLRENTDIVGVLVKRLAMPLRE